MKLAIVLLLVGGALLGAGCGSEPTRPMEMSVHSSAQRSLVAADSAQDLSWEIARTRLRATSSLWLPPNTTPQGAIARFIGAYERKLLNEYVGMFTGDFKYEFSTSTDPTLAIQYSTGWFKSDEMESANHLFSGYTPPGGATLPAASSIDIVLAVDVPVDDNTPGVDPVTHKLVATRVDGSIIVPQEGTEPVNYQVTNNYNVFYLVRGDVAVGLDSSQPADAHHWYLYHWVDLSEASPLGPQSSRVSPKSAPSTWGRIKGLYR